MRTKKEIWTDLLRARENFNYYALKSAYGHAFTFSFYPNIDTYNLDMANIWQKIYNDLRMELDDFYRKNPI